MPPPADFSEPDAPDPRGGQPEGGRGAEPAGADEQDARVRQPFLPRHPDLGEGERELRAAPAPDLAALTPQLFPA